MKRQRLVAIVIGVIAMMLFGRMLAVMLWHPEMEPAPWSDRPAIYEVMVQAQRAGQNPATVELPDAELYRQAHEGQVFVPGAADGIRAKHGTGRDDAATATLFAALQKALRSPQPSELKVLYEAMQVPALSVLDPLLDKIVADGSFNAKHLHLLAMWLAQKAPDREPVKTALGLLGIMPAFDDRELFLQLGRNDEFTLFAAVALANQMGPNSEEVLWALAKEVHGWGRIYLVDRLAQTQQPTIKHWLLTAGHQNAVAVEYSAYACATGGGLLPALASDTLGDDVFAGAGAILTALVLGQEGPAEGMADYADGAMATERYLWHAGVRQSLNPDDLTAIVTLTDYVQNLVDEQGRAAALGWSQARRDQIGWTATEILRRPIVQRQVEAELQRQEPPRFRRAARLALALGLGAADAELTRLLTEAAQTEVPSVEQRTQVLQALSEKVGHKRR